jgi:hypothetical protein
MQLHAESNTLVKQVLRIICRIDVVTPLALHESFVAVDDGRDDTVTNGLGDDLLAFLNGLKVQLCLDVSETDLAIADVQLLQTELEYSVPQSLDQGEVLVLAEDLTVCRHDLVELNHIAGLDAVDDLEVRPKRRLQELLDEDLAVRDLTHEQLDDDLQLQNFNPESLGANLGSFA